MGIWNHDGNESSLLRKTLVTTGAMVGSVVALLGTLSLLVLLVVGTGKTSSTASVADDAPSTESTGVKLPGTGPSKVKTAPTSKAPPAPGQEI